MDVSSRRCPFVHQQANGEAPQPKRTHFSLKPRSLATASRTIHPATSHETPTHPRTPERNPIGRACKQPRIPASTHGIKKDSYSMK
jgi:hypothetical protein